MEREGSTEFDWQEPDGAECSRLVKEMSEDAKLQFQVFIFGLTATAILLGFLAPPITKQGGFLDAWKASNPLAFLAPLLVLIPSSLMILNRARTRNRKSAYMICFLDRKRLRRAGVGDDTPLAAVRRWHSLPWETALHIRQRQRPHYAPTLLYMAICQVPAEALCLLFAGFALYRQWRATLEVSADPLQVAMLSAMTTFCLIGLPLWLASVAFRWWKFHGLRTRTSIQGFIDEWLKDTTAAPVYLRQYVEEYFGRSIPGGR